MDREKAIKAVTFIEAVKESLAGPRATTPGIPSPLPRFCGQTRMASGAPSRSGCAGWCPSC